MVSDVNHNGNSSIRAQYGLPEVIITCPPYGQSGRYHYCRTCWFSSWKKAVYNGKTNDVCFADLNCYTGFEE